MYGVRVPAPLRRTRPLPGATRPLSPSSHPPQPRCPRPLTPSTHGRPIALRPRTCRVLPRSLWHTSCSPPLSLTHRPRHAPGRRKEARTLCAPQPLVTSALCGSARPISASGRRARADHRPERAGVPALVGHPSMNGSWARAIPASLTSITGRVAAEIGHDASLPRQEDMTHEVYRHRRRGPVRRVH